MIPEIHKHRWIHLAKKNFDHFAPFIEGGYFIWGILFAAWSPILVVAGYWMEEACTLLYTLLILIILKIKNRKPVYFFKFLFIYGFFFLAHSIFVLILTGITSGKDPMSKPLFEAIFFAIMGHPFSIQGPLSTELLKIFLVVNAGILYTLYHRVFKKSQWRIVKPGMVINRSFGPIIASQFIIIFGIGAIILTDAPRALVVVLITVKILTDILGFGEKGSQIIKPEKK